MNDNTNNRDSLIGYFVTSMAQLMKGAGSHNTYMVCLPLSINIDIYIKYT